MKRNSLTTRVLAMLFALGLIISPVFAGTALADDDDPMAPWRNERVSANQNGDINEDVFDDEQDAVVDEDVEATVDEDIEEQAPLMLFSVNALNAVSATIEEEASPVLFAANEDTSANKRWTLTSAGWLGYDGKTVISGAKGKGIDVSEWNTAKVNGSWVGVNWNKVKKDLGKGGFAIIRIGFSGISTHRQKEDSEWIYNVNECKRLGIPFGLYFYSTARNKSEAVAEGAAVAGWLKANNVKPDYPVFYDVEDPDNQSALSRETFAIICEAWANEISKAGYKPGMYSMVSWFKSKMNAPVFDQWPRWVAHVYVNQPSYSGNYTIWQADFEAKVDGNPIANIDINFDFGTSKITANKWVKSGNTWQYTYNGVPVVPTNGWKRVDGALFYLDPNNNGKAKTGLFKVNGEQIAADTYGVVAENSWVTTGGKTYYSDGNAVVVTGWKKIGGAWYYFDPDNKGAMKTGWITLDGKKYYCDLDTGKMLTGKQTISNKSYEFDNNGVLITNTQPATTSSSSTSNSTSSNNSRSTSNSTSSNNSRSTSNSTSNNTSSATSSSSNRTSTTTGSVTTPTITKKGWNKVGSDWYWSDNGTSAYMGWKKVNDTWYYLQPSQKGKMAVGLFKDAKNKYYVAKASGECPANSWVKVGNDWYLTDGSCAVRTGWAKVNDVWYFLSPNNNGKMVAGTTWEINGRKSNFASSGAWLGYVDSSQSSSSSTSSSSSSNSGITKQGWNKIGGKWYWSDNGSTAKTGWLQTGGTWYWLKPNAQGRAAINWELINGTWYWFDPNTNAMQTGWKKINGTWYRFDIPNGGMKTGWRNENGTWYYLRSDGGMVADGIYTIDGRASSFAASGAWLGYV